MKQPKKFTPEFNEEIRNNFINRIMKRKNLIIQKLTPEKHGSVKEHILQGYDEMLIQIYK